MLNIKNFALLLNKDPIVFSQSHPILFTYRASQNAIIKRKNLLN